MANPKPDRFWKITAVAETEMGFAIELDGRRVKTPAKADLLLPTAPAGRLVADEWDAQESRIDPTVMPATRWANLANDKMPTTRTDVVQALVEYGGTDLLCYRATEPKALVDRQAAVWDDFLVWCETRWDAPLNVTQGLIPVPQPNQSLDNLRAAFSDFGPFSLAAFHDLVVISGSLVLALAIAEKKVTANEAWEASRVDENWQIEQWGIDDIGAQSAVDKRASFILAENLLEAVGNRAF